MMSPTLARQPLTSDTESVSRTQHRDTTAPVPRTVCRLLHGCHDSAHALVSHGGPERFCITEFLLLSCKIAVEDSKFVIVEPKYSVERFLAGRSWLQLAHLQTRLISNHRGHRDCTYVCGEAQHRFALASGTSQ